jgi:hypothetical protein
LLREEMDEREEREMYRSALGEIPLSESILAGGAPRTARDLRTSSVTHSTSLPCCSNPGAERERRGPDAPRRGGAAAG